MLTIFTITNKIGVGFFVKNQKPSYKMKLKIIN